MARNINFFHRLLFLIALSSLLGVSGCASSLDAESMAGVDLDSLQTFYVRKLPQDGRGIERLISERLNAMGKQSYYGASPVPPYPVDALVTYQDHWMWDITMYMIELDIQIRDPEKGVEFASGHSYRTSLVRKSPEEMIEEVLTRIFSS